MYRIKGTGRDGVALFDGDCAEMAAAFPEMEKRQAKDEARPRLSA
jgi:hypothetical protein